MIDESLLFRMGYLFPDITPTDIVISVFFVVLLAVFLFWKRDKSTPKKSPLPPLPIMTDAHFEEKLARYIRAKLAEKYSPEHTSAHTVREIETYAKSDPLVPLLTRLEEVEYTSKRLTADEREVMMKKVKK